MLFGPRESNNTFTKPGIIIDLVFAVAAMDLKVMVST